MSYSPEFHAQQVNAYRQIVRNTISQVVILCEQIERSLKENFSVVNPYKARV